MYAPQPQPPPQLVVLQNKVIVNLFENVCIVSE